MAKRPHRRKKLPTECNSPEEVARLYGKDWRERAHRFLEERIAELLAKCGLPPDFDPEDLAPPALDP